MRGRGASSHSKTNGVQVGLWLTVVEDYEVRPNPSLSNGRSAPPREAQSKSQHLADLTSPYLLPVLPTTHFLSGHYPLVALRHSPIPPLAGYHVHLIPLYPRLDPAEMSLEITTRARNSRPLLLFDVKPGCCIWTGPKTRLIV